MINMIKKKIKPYVPKFLWSWRDCYFYWRKRREINNLKVPTVLVFFITNRCNARCRHCFYWQEINKTSKEISLAEIKKMVISLKRPIHINLTGGEIYLRSDLVEICQIFDRVNYSLSLHISTNGILTEQIYDKTLEILKTCNFRKVAIQISLDGLAKTHDDIRRTPGAFNKAIETIKKISTLLNKYPLTIEIATVITSKNYNEIEDLIKFTQSLRVPHKFSFIRGAYSVFKLPTEIASGLDPEDEKNLILPIDKLEEITQKIFNLNDELEYKFLSLSQKRKLKLSLDVLKNKKRILPCFAGVINGVVYPNGDVAFCEHSRPFGNLKDTDFDLYKLWNSPQANEMRQKILSCACIHGCNLGTTLSVVPESIENKIKLLIKQNA